MAEPTEAQQHIIDLLSTLAQVHKHAEWLIADELKTQLPEYEAKEDEAAEALREAVSALEAPERELARLDDELSRVEGKCQEWSSQMSSPFPDRATARIYYESWQEELSAVQGKRDQLERDIEPLREHRDQCRKKLEQATSLREALELNMVIPTFAAGQTTSAYRAWILEQGLLVPVLLSGNRGHYQWKTAYDFMDVLCLRSGYRTDHLPSEAEKWRKYWADFQADHQGEPQQVDNQGNAVSGPAAIGEIHRQMRNLAENRRLEKTPQPNPEDRRGWMAHHARITRDPWAAVKVPEESKKLP